MRVLLVEDDRLTRAMVVDVLRARGHEPCPFPDAEAAWEACQQQPFELAILDWVLPGMTGLELCRRLRGLAHGQDTLILVMTSREQPQDLAAVLDAGADDYLPKSGGLQSLAIRLHVAERRVAELATHREAEAEAVRARLAEAEAMALLELSRQQKLLLNLITHELNTPLSAILGFSELLLDGVPSPEVLEQGLRAIHRGAARQHALVSDVLELAQLQGHECRLDLQPLDLGHFLPTWLDDLPGSSRLVVEVEAGLPSIEADSPRLYRAIRQVVDNALKFSPEDRPVRIEVARAGQWALAVRVHDRGSGITSEEQERIFEPFYRTTETHSAAVRGSGLGLALARRFVEAHGGQIHVESRLGEGTTFAITLPLHPVLVGAVRPFDHDLVDTSATHAVLAQAAVAS